MMLQQPIISSQQRYVFVLNLGWESLRSQRQQLVESVEISGHGQT